MKILSRITCLAAALLIGTGASMAGAKQGAEDMPARGKFMNIGYGSLHLKQPSVGTDIKSDLSVSFTKGNTYFLHKPIAHRLRFGIDAVWTDINYTNYKFTDEYGDKNTHHEVEVGLQVGPSVTFNIHRNSQLQAYFRYAPCFSGFYDGDDFQAGFGNFFCTGGSISWKAIGIGVEARYGQTKYKPYDLDSLIGGDGEKVHHDKIKTKLSGVRAYVQFRF